MNNWTATKEQHDKYDALKAYLRELGSVAVAFSSGVDSTFLLKTAHDVLGDNCIAITAVSPFFPEREREEARLFCEKEGIRQITLKTRELEIEGFRENPANRCYICKKSFFGEILKIAEKEGIHAVAEGSNMDDTKDYRPGMLAIKELNLESPLRRCGLYKEDIRALSRELELPTWKKQSFACLYSRFAYGETITEEKVKMVDQAEQLLLEMGFEQFRVRIHGMLARIEVWPEEFEKIMANKELIAASLKSFGFTYVTLDLQGYRVGSMNEALSDRVRSSFGEIG